MSFPKELKNKKQWVCWRFEPDLNGGKPKKVPINPVMGKGRTMKRLSKPQIALITQVSDICSQKMTI